MLTEVKSSLPSRRFPPTGHLPHFPSPSRRGSPSPVKQQQAPTMRPQQQQEKRTKTRARAHERCLTFFKPEIATLLQKDLESPRAKHQDNTRTITTSQQFMLLFLRSLSPLARVGYPLGKSRLHRSYGSLRQGSRHPSGLLVFAFSNTSGPRKVVGAKDGEHSFRFS